MNSPGTRSRDNKPGNPSGKRPSKQTLRVLSDDGAMRPAPSIAMPRAKTELSELLAGDDTLCVRRLGSAAAAQNRTSRPLTSAAASPDCRAKTSSSMADEQLAFLIDAWPRLSPNIRAAIWAMVASIVTRSVSEVTG